MSLQNRVRPEGEIFETTARGTFLGNRGILQDENKRIVRHSRGDLWQICQLEFKGRKQELMHPRRYTQLFFLDEAVAWPPVTGRVVSVGARTTGPTSMRSTWRTRIPSSARGS